MSDWSWLGWMAVGWFTAIVPMYSKPAMDALRLRRHTRCERCGRPINDQRRVSMKYDGAGEVHHYFDRPECAHGYMRERKAKGK